MIVILLILGSSKNSFLNILQKFMRLDYETRNCLEVCVTCLSIGSYANFTISKKVLITQFFIQKIELLEPPYI